MAQYRTKTVTDGIMTNLDKAIDNEAHTMGKDGWRISSVTKLSKSQARVEFVKG